jgi:hypothetical protein
VVDNFKSYHLVRIDHAWINPPISEKYVDHAVRVLYPN